jgi:hypothetical protein
MFIDEADVTLSLIFRINWSEAWVPSNSFSNSKAKASSSSDDVVHDADFAAPVALPPGVTAEAFESSNAQYYSSSSSGGLDMDAAEEEEEEEEADSDADDNDQGEGERGGSGEFTNGGGLEESLQGTAVSSLNNRCDLLWQGLQPKRCFTGFKFQESQSALAARKMMKGRGVGHFWDMLEGADHLLASAAAPTLF